MALVGPLTSLVLAGLSWVVMIATRSGNAYVYALSSWLSRINLSLAFFNLIPGFPLDGGRVFRAIVWAVTRNLRLATRVATSLGRLVAYGFILLGIVQLFGGNWADGLWIAFIGWFLENAAMASYRRMALHDMLAGHVAREVMTAECSVIPPHLTLDLVVDQLILPTGRRCFPVQEAGELRGLLTVHNIKEVPRQKWRDTRVQEIMIPRTELKSVRPDEELSAVFDKMTSEDVNQLAVVDDGQLLGMVARDNLLQFMRLRAELGI
jgi:CBS domain-containing protein